MHVKTQLFERVVHFAMVGDVGSCPPFIGSFLGLSLCLAPRLPLARLFNGMAAFATSAGQPFTMLGRGWGQDEEVTGKKS